jgi:hypothetical protein
MDSFRLQRWQLERISDKVGESLKYLTQLQRRMEKTSFSPGDPLFVRVSEAQKAMQSLFMECHYLMCDGGVGRPSCRTNPDPMVTGGLRNDLCLTDQPVSCWPKGAI